MRASFSITLFLVFASLTPRLAAEPQPAAVEKLQHALRLADLYNWADAGPDFAEAQRLFLAAGDQRNALYARLGVIRSNSEQHPLPETSAQLAKDLESNPIQLYHQQDQYGAFDFPAESEYAAAVFRNAVHYLNRSYERGECRYLLCGYGETGEAV